MNINPKIPLLLNSYKKEKRSCILKPHPYETYLMGGIVNLSPVLFHGTNKARIEQWQKELGIGGEQFSTTSSPNVATTYATESNLYNQALFSSDLAAIDLEWGVITFFDRDSLLRLEDSNPEIILRHDIENGLMLQWKESASLSKRTLPIDSMFASLYLHLPTRKTEFNIINQALWDENFSQISPNLDTAHFYAQFISTPETYFQNFAQELFGIYSI